jgi:hypothetical protein
VATLEEFARLNGEGLTDAERELIGTWVVDFVWFVMSALI